MVDRGYWLWALFLGVVWLLLTDGAISSWAIGVPAILVAAWAARHLQDAGGVSAPGSASLRGAALFLPFFVRESVRGGIDVARRVFAPTPRIDPGFHDYVLRLKNPSARLLFVNSISLLPGTLAAELLDDRVRVHALDVNTDNENELKRLERRVSMIYGEGE
jgi:multicomponent Na+:H+ antiporter subunit E